MKAGRSKTSSGGTKPTSEDELDEFYTRPPVKRARIVPSSPPPSSSGPSSELDVLASDSESSPKTKKGKAKAKPRATAKKPLKKAAPVPIQKLYKSASIVIDSDEEDDNGGELPVQSTQHLKQGDEELRQLAASRGWKGNAKQQDAPLPPPPLSPRAPSPAPAPAGPSRSTKVTKANASATKAPVARDRSASSDLTASRSSKLVPSTSPSTSPARVVDPPAPVVAVKDFWGAGTSRPAMSAAKQQTERGKELRAKGAKLESLSFIRKDLRLDESAKVDELESEDEEGSGEDPYELSAVKEKRLRKEKLAALKLHRQRKPDPPPPAPQEQCAICDKLVPSSTLEAHSISCFEAHQKRQPAVPPPPPKRKTTPTTAEKHQSLVNDLAFSPPIPVTAKWDAATKGKGKARAPEPEPEPEPVAEEDDEFEFDFPDDDGVNWEEFEQEAEYGDEEPEEDEDDDDDVLIDDSWQAPPAKVNSMRARGPPVGESPPKGSIYISTLPREMRLGYERMYTLKSAPAAEQVQKMSAPKKYGAAAGGGRGKWGAKRGGGFKGRRGGRKR